MAATAIAEYAVAAAAHFARGLHEATRQKAAGQFTREGYAMSGLRGATMGVIGLGGIGREVARLARAVGMRVIGTRGSVTAALLSFQGTPPGPPGTEGAPPGSPHGNAAVSGTPGAEAEVRASWLLLSAGVAGTTAPWSCSGLSLVAGLASRHLRSVSLCLRLLVRGRLNQSKR